MNWSLIEFFLGALGFSSRTSVFLWWSNSINWWFWRWLLILYIQPVQILQQNNFFSSFLIYFYFRNYRISYYYFIFYFQFYFKYIHIMIFFVFQWRARLILFYYFTLVGVFCCFLDAKRKYMYNIMLSRNK